MFWDITLYEFKWKNLGVKQFFKIIGASSQIKNIL